MSAGFHAMMSLFSWRNLRSVSSYLGSRLFPMSATLEGLSGERETVLLSESSGLMDILGALASGMTRSRGGGGLSQGLLSPLEFYGCCEPVGRLTALPIIVIGVLDVSPDGDDTMRS
jgi:hypothetical protein